MSKKLFSVILGGLLIILSLGSCGDSSDSSEAGRKTKYDANSKKPVTLERVISVAEKHGGTFDFTNVIEEEDDDKNVLGFKKISRIDLGDPDDSTIEAVEFFEFKDEEGASDYFDWFYSPPSAGIPEEVRDDVEITVIDEQSGSNYKSISMSMYIKPTKMTVYSYACMVENTVLEIGVAYDNRYYVDDIVDELGY